MKLCIMIIAILESRQSMLPTDKCKMIVFCGEVAVHACIMTEHHNTLFVLWCRSLHLLST